MSSFLLSSVRTLASNALPITGGTLTGTLNGTTINGTTINASTSIQTAGVVRIGATGVLSNVSAPAGAAATVSIDAAIISSGTLAAARLPFASTGAAGIVQLSDSTSTTSSTTAATSTAVKSAYDLAASAIPSNGATLTNATLAGGFTNTGAMSLNLYGTPTFYSGTNNATNNSTTLPANTECRLRLATASALNWSPTYSANARLNIPVNGVYAISLSCQGSGGWEWISAILKSSDTLTTGDGKTLAVTGIPYIGSGGLQYMSTSATTTLSTTDTLSFYIINRNSSYSAPGNYFSITVTLLHKTS